MAMSFGVQSCRQRRMDAGDIGPLVVALARPLADGSLVHVPLDARGPIWSDLGVYVRTGRSLPGAIDSFLQLLGEEIAARENEESALTS